MIDNTIDQATGTIHLKATFANQNERLWPGEFVNVRLVLLVRHERRHGAGADRPGRDRTATIAYVIGKDDTVERRAVEVAAVQDGLAVISKGLTRRRARRRRGPVPADRRRPGQTAAPATSRRIGRLRLDAAAMSISEPFIRRPIATSLLMLGILVFGIVAYTLLPVAALPNVDFPTITVTASYPGRQPRDHGLGGRHAAGAAVRRDPGAGPDDLD